MDRDRVVFLVTGWKCLNLLSRLFVLHFPRNAREAYYKFIFADVAQTSSLSLTAVYLIA